MTEQTDDKVVALVREAMELRSAFKASEAAFKAAQDDAMKAMEEAGMQDVVIDGDRVSIQRRKNVKWNVIGLRSVLTPVEYEQVTRDAVSAPAMTRMIESGAIPIAKVAPYAEVSLTAPWLNFGKAPADGGLADLLDSGLLSGEGQTVKQQIPID